MNFIWANNTPSKNQRPWGEKNNIRPEKPSFPLLASVTSAI